MRIIGGTAKGRRIYLPKGCGIRPTSDRIKETLFNILQPIEGKAFLEVFAGSGNMGIEALSRGASRVVLIEKDFALAKAIRKNIDTFGFGEHSETLAMEVKRGVRLLCARGEQFDIVFADPPYEINLVEMTLQYLKDGRLLLPDGIIAIQHSMRETCPNTLADQYVLTAQRRCGDTTLSFLKRIPGE